MPARRKVEQHVSYFGISDQTSEWFLSRTSNVERDSAILNPSVNLSVCLSVCLRVCLPH